MNVRALLIAGGLATLVTAPAMAATRHHASHSSSHSAHHGAAKSKAGSASHHGKSGHGSTASHGKTKTSRKTGATKAPGAPAGATAIASGGTKLFCAGHASPLLVRKATQGSGTTVTVICR